MATKVASSQSSSSSDNEEKERKYNIQSSQTRSYIPSDFSLPRTYPASQEKLQHQRVSYHHSESYIETSVSYPPPRYENISSGTKPRKSSSSSSSSSDSSRHDAPMKEIEQGSLEQRAAAVGRKQSSGVKRQVSFKEDPIHIERKVSVSSSGASEDYYQNMDNIDNVIDNAVVVQMARKVSVSSSESSQAVDNHPSNMVGMARKVSVSSSAASEDFQGQIQMARRVSDSSAASSDFQEHRPNGMQNSNQIPMARKVSAMSSSAASSGDFILI